MYTTRFLDELEKVFERLKRDEPAVAFKFTRSPTDRPKQSAWLNFDVGDVFGEVIVWESGECDRYAGSPNGDLVPHTTAVLESPGSVPQVVLNLLSVATAEASTRGARDDPEIEHHGQVENADSGRGGLGRRLMRQDCLGQQWPTPSHL